MSERTRLFDSTAWSLLRSSFKIFSKAWGMESITFHIAMPVLQGRELCQQGCLGCHSSTAGESPAQRTPLPLGSDTLGSRRGLRWCSPWGWEERGGSGLAWPALAAAGLADPPGLESVVGWRALLLGGVLQHYLDLAARESLSPSPHREQALVAFGASTCLLLERSSTGS